MGEVVIELIAVTRVATGSLCPPILPATFIAVIVCHCMAFFVCRFMRKISHYPPSGDVDADADDHLWYVSRIFYSTVTYFLAETNIRIMIVFLLVRKPGFFSCSVVVSLLRSRS